MAKKTTHKKPFAFAVNEATLMKTPMEPYLDAIAAAGFTGVELRRDETFEYLKTHSVNDLKNALIKNQLKVVSWNAIELFSLCDDAEFKRICEYTERLMKLGNELGTEVFPNPLIIAVPSFLDRMNVVGNDKAKVREMTLKRFHILREMAKKYHFRMGFEPLGFPTCSVRKIKDALEVLKEAEKDGLPPSGLVIDTFHFFLGEHAAAELTQIPTDKLWLVHFNDCVKKPIDVLQDADRVWPGLGYFDLQGFVASLNQMNYKGYISMELFNPAYWKGEPKQTMKDGFAAMMKFF